MRGVTIAAAALVLGLTGCSSMFGSGTSGSSTAGYAGSSAPSAGSSLPSAALSESQVRQELNNQGYTGVTNLQRSGGGWTGTATHNGSTVDFSIDQNGVIHTQ